MTINPFAPKPLTHAPTVAIIGGGVSGLSVAWQALKMGCAVTIYDSGTLCNGATNAAAGMLATGVECEPGEESLLSLNLHAQNLWADFKSQLEHDSGQSTDYRNHGTMVVATNRDDLAQVRFSYEFQKSLGVDLHWLSPPQLREKEPYLRSTCTGGYYSPNDHQVDNVAVGHALITAVKKLGATLHENTPITALSIQNNRATGVIVGGKTIPYDKVIVCTGAWSGGLNLPFTLPVRPIKGQMLSLQMDASNPIITHVLWAPKIYLVPRNDGRLIIGATVEEQGFNPTLTAGGILALLESAWRAVPALEELPYTTAWVGFRPGSRDDAPILGGCDIANLILATGHHRNGILQAPITAHAIAQFIATETLPNYAEPFTIRRFKN